MSTYNQRSSSSESTVKVTEKGLQNFHWKSTGLEQILEKTVSSRYLKCFLQKGRIIPFFESDLEAESNKTFWESSGLTKSLVLDDHYYYRIEDCYLNPRHGVVIIDNHFIEETKIYTGAKKIFDRPRKKTDNFFELDSKLFSNAYIIDVPVFALSTSPGMNYCHFNLDITSGIIPIIDQIRNGKIKLLWSGGFNSFQKQILKNIGVKEEHIIFNNSKLIFCKSLIKSSSNFHTYKRSLSSSVEQYFPFLTDMCTPDHKPEKLPDKILIERSKKTTRRINMWEKWEELTKLAKSYDFEVIDPGTLQFSKQIEIFRNAKIIIAQHGAALTNCGHLSADTHVLEILPDKRLTKLFYCLSKLRNARHHILLAKSERIAEGEALNSYKFEIPIDEIKLILKKIL